MKIATILPTNNLDLVEGDDYHLCLAHLVSEIAGNDYTIFFRKQSLRGAYVMLDNGVVETGEPMETYKLIMKAATVQASEVCLPDYIHDHYKTLHHSYEALIEINRSGIHVDQKEIKLMAIPQGTNPGEWLSCAKEMLQWPIDTIGISKFVSEFFPNRATLLTHCPEIIGSDKEIHILGCPGDPLEILDIEREFPGRVRGVDSGIAAMFTQQDLVMSNWLERGVGRPKMEMDFNSRIMNKELLLENISWWRDRCQQR